MTSRATTSGSRPAARFTMPPTDVTAPTIAMLNDTCGNLIQLTQLVAREAVMQPH